MSLTASLAQAAGFRLIDIPANNDGPALKGAIWYPCTQPLRDVKLGPYVIAVAKDCPIIGSKLPLVVISHGWGGTFLGHRDTAETLADAGFVVAAINHGDSAMNPRRDGDLSVLVERPVDIRRVLDFMLGAWPDGSKIDVKHIGFFGFSRGGYTGLVSIGANPASGKAPQVCGGTSSPTCNQPHIRDLLKLGHDPRIKAAVIADPLSDFFTPESLKNVKVPVQLWSSNHGGDGVTPESVTSLARKLPMTVEFHLVPNSQHFAFLSPCPATMAERAPDICSDPPGFDRGIFHKELNASMLAFFRKNFM